MRHNVRKARRKTAAAAAGNEGSNRKSHSLPWGRPAYQRVPAVSIRVVGWNKTIAVAVGTAAVASDSKSTVEGAFDAAAAAAAGGTAAGR